MAGNELKAKLVIEAQSKGQEGIVGLRGELDKLADGAEKAAAVMADRELLGVRAHAEVQKEIDATRAAYERLKASGQLSQAELAQAALKTEERIRELHQQTNGWADSLGKAKLAFSALAAGGAGIAAVVRQAMDFESAMADVAKVVDGTDEQVGQLAARIKDMTREIPLAATELAQMAAAGGQLGVPLQQLDEFVRLAAQMATAFGLSAEQAGQAVAKLSNIFNLPLEQVRELGDAINTLGNNMAAKEGDIVEVLTRIGGAAGQFGLSASQAAALGASMLSLGVSAEVAGTGINAILAKLQTAGIQGKEFQAALADMGLSAKQLAADIAANPQKALEEFLQALAKLEGAQKAEVLAKLFGQEYQDDVARLLAGLGQYDKALGLVADKAATAGAMQGEFAARVKTTEAQLKLLQGSVQAAAINLGSALLPVLRAVASSLSDGTRAVADLAQKFPELASAAGVFVTLAANAAALRLAWLALGVAGAKAFAGVAAQVSALNVGMTQLAAQSSIAAAAIKSAGLLAASGWIGWQIGKGLREEFLVIEQAGIALAAGLTKAAAYAQAAWESLKAPFTDDTIEAASERLSQKLQQIDDDYAALFESAAQARQGQEQLAQAAETAAAAVQQVAVQTQQAAGAMGQAMAGAVKTIDEVDQAMQRAGVSAQATGSALEAAFLQAVPKAQTLADIQALQDKLQALAEAGRIGADGVKAITGAIADHAQSIGQAMVGAIATIDQVDQAMRRAGVSARATASALQEAFSQAIGQAKTLADIEALEKKLKDLEAAGRIGAEGVKAIAEAIARQRQSIEATDQARQAMLEGFKELGADGAAALGQISEGAQKAIDAVDKIAVAAKEAGLGVEAAARSIEMAFTAAVPKADSLQAIEALESRLKAAGQAGQIGAEGIARVQAALDKQRAAIEQQLPGIQSLEEALKQLGVTPQKELDRLAQSAKEAFEAVKQSGQATPREINEAWKKMAEAAIAANDGVADASLKAAAQQHGFAIETDKAGKSIIKSMEEAKEATEGVGKAAEKSGDKMADAAKKAKDAWADGSLVEQAEKHNAALGKIEGSWIRADVAASQYARQIAQVIWEQGKAIAQMTEEHARLVQQMEALSEQQRHLEAVNNDAVRGLEALRLRYLELTGDQEAAAELKMQMARQEIDLKLALLEIDLQRAQIAGDTAEVKKMELQIAALKEQLTWLDKIHAKEKELRKEREREERSHGRSSGGGSGSGSGGSAGSLPPPTPTPAPQPAPPAPPVNITLHAHGITDPVRLAKAIEPELARLARLAR
ncbi:phage tail tape measure protein [Allofranklinella schreckenbergeri]|uniref:Phage tail tape measure protein n=1 Tax=Allofranklinella schreckenbergeri TaxID=1076744 RepID=A0A3M6QWQ4_9BURK|nr:phage tail tape measure protein [Allofranklinella schreckenbergeri]RMX07413.1 phage tail tape measure protein [Allofranklinella schreckenbergeri]